MEVDEPKPSPPEIKAALNRLMASGAFTRRQKPSEVFDLLVRKSLNGITLSEEDIRREIYPTPPYDPRDPHVRTAIHAIRNSMLPEYYESEGWYDPIEISLPKRDSRSEKGRKRREAYPVVAKYSLIYSKLTTLKIARSVLSQGTPHAIRRSLALFEAVTRVHPKHFDASLARVECLCLDAICFAPTRPHQEIIDEALSIAEYFVSENPKRHRAHLAHGIALLFANRLNESYSAFNRVAEISPEHLYESFWLSALLICLNRTSDACKMCAQMLFRRGDVPAWTIYGLCLYMDRQFKESKDILLTLARLLDNWLACIGLTCLYLSTGQPEDAVTWYREAANIISRSGPFMPGLGLLAAQRADTKDEKWVNFLRAAVLVNDDLADVNRDWIQLALCLIDGWPASAVNALIVARHYRHPLAMIISSCPLFDPLREHPDFPATY